MKFGGGRSEMSGPNKSPMMGNSFVHLNTIEEERYETHTSNYMDGMSERDDSKLLSSNQLRNSQIGKDLDLESQDKEAITQKMSPDLLNNSLGNESNKSQPFGENQSDIDGSGRDLDGKLGNFKLHANKMSKSLAETSLEQLKDK